MGIERSAELPLGARVRPTEYDRGGFMSDVWTYRNAILGSDVSAQNLIGYGVEAEDGSIGKVDAGTYEAGASHLVVDTGLWIFGKKVMLPAGVVSNVDHDEEKVYVDRNKDQIKTSPEYDDSLTDDEEYRARLGSYGPGGFWIPG
jgi:hypothetical protein